MFFPYCFSYFSYYYYYYCFSKSHVLCWRNEETLHLIHDRNGGHRTRSYEVVILYEQMNNFHHVFFFLVVSACVSKRPLLAKGQRAEQSAPPVKKQLLEEAAVYYSVHGLWLTQGARFGPTTIWWFMIIIYIYTILMFDGRYQSQSQYACWTSERFTYV